MVILGGDETVDRVLNISQFIIATPEDGMSDSGIFMKMRSIFECHLFGHKLLQRDAATFSDKERRECYSQSDRNLNTLSYVPHTIVHNRVKRLI